MAIKFREPAPQGYAVSAYHPALHIKKRIDPFHRSVNVSLPFMRLLQAFYALRQHLKLDSRAAFGYYCFN